METILNNLICFLVTRTHLYTTTIWVIFESLDTKLSKMELEYYINEYRKGKAEGHKFYKRP